MGDAAENESSSAAENESSSAAGTVQLDVDLDTTANPPLIVTRDKKAKLGDKIKWKKASNAPDFTFTAFDGDDPPFNEVDIADNKIECDFEPTDTDPPDTLYKYTLTVTYANEEYETTKQIGDPTGDKPVIRNL